MPKRNKLVGLLWMVVVLPTIIPASHQPHLMKSSTPAVFARCSNPSGVTRKADGTYLFARLQVVNSAIVDGNNCPIYLRGFGTAGVEFGDAVGGLSVGLIAKYNKFFHMNLWRLAVNAYWWVKNGTVPDAGMPYQQWVELLITWLEQNGNYVEIDKATQFDEPPCKPGVTFCTKQNTGSREYSGDSVPGDPDPGDPTALSETCDGTDITAALQMWADLATMYKNDPAVIYDTWNEVHSLEKRDPAQWQHQQTRLITTIRTFAPLSLIVLPMGSDDMTANLHYTQKNLAYDFHVYPNSVYAQFWPIRVNEAISYAHADGNAVFFNEWGGTHDANPYSDKLVAYAINNKISISFYQSGVVLSHGRPNQLGTLIQGEYAGMPW